METGRGRASEPLDLVGLGALIAASPLGYLTVGLDGRVLSHNRGAAAVAARDDLVGARLLDLLVPADRTGADALLTEATHEDDVREARWRVRRADGAPAHVLACVARVTRPDGGLSHLALTWQDDTERHQAAERLSRRAARATTLLRALPDAVLICAPDGVVIEVNDQTQTLFGYEAAELVGRPIELLVPDAVVAAHRWHRERYTATAHSRPMITGPDINGRHKDGHEIPVEVNLAGATVESGPVVVASVRDVTEQRAQAHRLRESLDLVSSILAAATQQAIVTVDLDGRIETFSRGAELMLGYTVAEAVGQPVSILEPPTGPTTSPPRGDSTTTPPWTRASARSCSRRWPRPGRGPGSPRRASDATSCSRSRSAGRMTALPGSSSSRPTSRSGSRRTRLWQRARSASG